jgi:hypothetical protein
MNGHGTTDIFMPYSISAFTFSRKLLAKISENYEKFRNIFR